MNSFQQKHFYTLVLKLAIQLHGINKTKITKLLLYLNCSVFTYELFKNSLFMNFFNF